MEMVTNLTALSDSFVLSDCTYRMWFCKIWLQNQKFLQFTYMVLLDDTL